MAKHQLPNDLLHLIEAGIGIALLGNDNRRSEDWEGDAGGSDEEQRVVEPLLDESIDDEKKAFKQQTKLGWGYIFTGNFSEGWKKFWKDKPNWALQFAILMLEWGRACYGQGGIRHFIEENLREAGYSVHDSAQRQWYG